MNTYLYDEFVNVVAGNPIRLFRFGKLVKGGRVRQITKSLARKFRIPHFKPPIKLGSHEVTTPAGGHIVDLEVRDDGLYGIPELNDAGRKAIANGSYKYQSPEVIWDDDKGFEDPNTGELISGPLVVGMALIHDPHLGESAALYRVEPLEVNTEDEMGNEGKVTLSLESLLDFIRPKAGEDVEPEPVVVEPEDYGAMKETIATLEAEKADRDTEDEKATTLEAIREEFKAEPLSEIVEVEGSLDILASMSPEQRAWCVERFTALTAEVDLTKVIDEEGVDGEGETEPESVNAAITAYAAEHKLSYVEAFDKLRVEKPELFKQEE